MKGKRMRILIVDDERLVRITLESMLRELGETGVIVQARSSEEMCAVLRQSSYDLIFLDINMPGQQGLEAMEAVRKENTETSWCILTGYSQFEYAKKALELGAKGYLLKPPDPEELARFLAQLQTERRERQRRNQSLLAEAIQKGIYLDDFEKIFSEERGRYVLYSFFVDLYSEEKRRRINRCLYERLEAFMGQYRESRGGEFALFFSSTGELCMVLSGEGGLQMNAFLRTYMTDYAKEAEISGFFSEFTEIRELKGTLKFQLALAPLRFYSRNMEIVSVKELDQDVQIMRKQYFAVQLEKLLSEYMAGDIEAFHQELRKMELEERSRTEDNGFEVLTGEVKAHLESILEHKFEADGISALLQELREECSRREGGIAANQELIWKICSYVKQNYMEDVSIDRLGEVFQITPTYLSRFFREKTGKKYIDYVTAVRMEKAKELLGLRQYSVKEVSQMVGYASEKHFSRNFKKHYGKSPSQMT